MCISSLIIDLTKPKEEPLSKWTVDEREVAVQGLGVVHALVLLLLSLYTAHWIMLLDTLRRGRSCVLRVSLGAGLQCGSWRWMVE